MRLGQPVGSVQSQAWPRVHSKVEVAVEEINLKLLLVLLVLTAAYCIFSGLVVAKGGLLKLGRVSPLRPAKGAS